MIRINQVKLHTEHTRQELIKKIASLLRVAQKDILHVEIIRQSIDARKKPDIYAIFSVNALLSAKDGQAVSYSSFLL